MSTIRTSRSVSRTNTTNATNATNATHATHATMQPNATNATHATKEETKDEGFIQKLLNGDLKQPIIIAIKAPLYFVTPQVNKVLLSTGISVFVGEDGSISMIGTAFKCLTIGILYYLFQTLQK